MPGAGKLANEMASNPHSGRAKRCFPRANRGSEESEPPTAPGRFCGPLLSDVAEDPDASFDREIRRRTDVVERFPARASRIRLGGAVLADQNDVWKEGRRYLGLDALVLLNSRAVEPIVLWRR